MPYFNKQNQVHPQAINVLHSSKLSGKLVKLNSDQLFKVAHELNEKNVKRNKKGLASVYFPTKATPNGKIVITYPKLLGGKILYDNLKLQAQDESYVWKLLKNAVKIHNEAKPAAPPAAAEEIATVNVLETSEGTPTSLHSWPETPEGNKAAEAYFRKKAEEDFHLTPEAMDAAVEDGYCGNSLFLVHSN